MNTQTLYPQSEALITKERVAAEARPKAATRLLFVDNLRIFLTVLVILHHLMNIYAGSGGWIYQEGRQDLITAVLGKWFTTVNHAYFMGLFLLIAAYFVPGSYDRKGAWNFVKDRLVRLGIPLVLYSWVIRPLLIYAALSAFGEMSQPLLAWYPWHYFQDYSFLGGGPLWFISALLIFSLVYAIVRKLMPTRPLKPLVETSFPSNRSNALLALLIAVVAFIVRLWYPSDKVFGPLAFQFADFPQYIALFIIGVLAYRRNWLTRLPEKAGKLWMKIAAGLILLWPPIVLLLGAFEDTTPFLGGLHWQSALSAIWQSFLGVAMCVSVIHIFKNSFNRQGTVSSFLSRNAYTAYLIHEAVITILALLVIGVMIYPLLKFALMALVAVPLTFGLSSLIRKLPFTERVL